LHYAERNICAMADYFASGCKADKLLGLELEHFVVDAATLAAIPYENGVERLLLNMASQCGGVPNFVDGRILGLQFDDAYISLEPAAQVEISVRPVGNIAEIAKIYDAFVKRISPILHEMGYALLCMGYQPVSSATVIPLIPYKRYEFMDGYFSSTGGCGVNMMRGSAATQVSIDYKNETDFSKKFRVANILGLLFSLACDNADSFEGRAKRLIRTYIWNDVDPARSGVAHAALDGDFGFYDYARYVYGVPPIFLGGEYTGRTPASEIFAHRAMTPEEIEHLTSMVFTDVRLKTCMEIRMADSMPISAALAYTDMLKNIFYDEARLAELHEKTRRLKNCDVQKAKAALLKNGADAIIYGKPAQKWLHEIFGGASVYEEFEQTLRKAGTRAI